MALHYQADFSATTVVRELALNITPKLINRITTLPLGIKWDREDKVTSSTAKKVFFLAKEKHKFSSSTSKKVFFLAKKKHIEDKNGERRENLPYP